MTMQWLRSATDSREFETRLRAIRNTRRHLDATDLAEISATRNRIDECETIARLIIPSIHVGELAQCVATSVHNALLAVDLFATARGELWDSTMRNDGCVDAWGWSDETPDTDMNWRVRITIS